MTNINAPISEVTKDRYKILYDQIHTINAYSQAVATSLVKHGEIMLHGSKVQYTDEVSGSPSVNSLVSKNLIWIYFCAGSTETEINFASRVYYHDD